MDDKGLTNQELEKLTKSILGEKFLGVYPCDSTPRIIDKQIFSVIFNMSKHNENGSHFISILKKNQTVFYFDSRGKKCDNVYILNFLKHISNKYSFNNFQMQNDSSIFCGVYCLGFLVACQKLNFQPKTYIDLFLFNDTLNDQIVTEFIVSHLSNK